MRPRGLIAKALLGGAVATGFLAILFAGYELWLRSREWGIYPADRGYPQGYFRRQPDGIHKAGEGSWRIVTKSAADGHVLYDVVYTIDRFGKRVTPVQASEDRKRFAMFFGCSYTFGEGVGDDETLPYNFAKLAPEYEPYNFGFHGGGPFEALARMENLDFSAEVAEKQGIAIYTYIDSHIHRVNDSSLVSFWHSEEIFYEQRPDGTFVRNGTFASAHPIRTKIYQLVYGSRLLRYLGVQLPFKTGKKHLDLTAASLGAIARKFAGRFPGSEFYVLIYPGTWSADAITRRLDAMGVRYLDYSTLFDRTSLAYRISLEDTHPTPRAHQEVAAALARDLKDKRQSSLRSR